MKLSRIGSPAPPRAGRGRSITLAAGVAMLVAAAVLTALGRDARAAFPGPNGWLVFGADLADGHHSCVMSADGTSGPFRVDPSGQSRSDSSWSADGSQLVFALANSIARSNANGTGTTELVPRPGNAAQAAPKFSPSGSVAFASNREAEFDRDFDIFVFDGTSITKVADGSQPHILGRPAWSPNGTKIAYEDWTPAPGRQPQTGEILVINADGTGAQNITNTADVIELAPAWSPDGSKIAFATGPFGDDVWVMNADGTSRVRLTNAAGIDNSPAWSPDGSQIAFISRRDNSVGELYVMNADGSGQHRVTFNTVREYWPDWRPAAGAVESSGTVCAQQEQTPSTSTTGPTTTTTTAPAASTTTVAPATTTSVAPATTTTTSTSTSTTAAPTTTTRPPGPSATTSMTQPADRPTTTTARPAMVLADTLPRTGGTAAAFGVLSAALFALGSMLIVLAGLRPARRR